MMPQGRWTSFSLLLLVAPLTGFASADFPAPLLQQNSLELKNTATTLSYNRALKVADWAFYPLGPAQLEACVDRGNSFRPDPRLNRDEAAELADYKGSGFDRGHLSPAGDNRWSQAAMDESFVLSNVTPQPPAFNRGIWGRLENLVRAWASAKGGLWVATGPLLTGKLDTIGDDKLAVAQYFYKVIATQKGDVREAAAFLLPTDASGDFGQYETSVSHLEQLSGLTFLDGLPGEREVKDNLNPKSWDLSAKFSYLPCSSVKPSAMEWAWGLTAP
jgi:endonuclease G